MGKEVQWAQKNSGHRGTVGTKEQGVQVSEDLLHYSCQVQKQCNFFKILRMNFIVNFKCLQSTCFLAALTQEEHLVRSGLIMGVAQLS